MSRAAVADLGLKHPFNAGHGVVTLSAGVATCVPGGSASGWQSLVREADAALYAAKESGRDRVVTYRAVLPVHTERRPLSMAAGLP